MIGFVTLYATLVSMVNFTLSWVITWLFGHESKRILISTSLTSSDNGLMRLKPGISK